MAINGVADDSVGGNDPVFETALAELESSGALGSESSDPESGATSQPTSESAASPAAAPDKSGDGESDAKDSKTPSAKDTPQQQVPASDTDDPLKGTEPFKYYVNGVEKTLEGVYRVPGEGLLVPEDKVGALQQLAERAEILDRVSREAEGQASELGRLARWVTTDDNGKETTHEGKEGLVAMRVHTGKLAASFDTLASVFRPDKSGGYSKLQSLIAVDEATGQIVPNQQALQYLLTEADLSEMKAEQAVREALNSISSPTQPQAPASGSPDMKQVAPQVIEQAARSLSLDAKALTEKDRSFLSSVLPRYLRPVTQEDRRYNPSLVLGSPIVDASFTQVVKDRAEMRAEASKAVSVAEQAGKFNAGQSKGRQPVKGQAPKAPTQEAPKDTKRKRADWDSPLTEAMAEMGVTQ